MSRSVSAEEQTYNTIILLMCSDNPNNEVKSVSDKEKKATKMKLNLWNLPYKASATSGC